MMDKILKYLEIILYDDENRSELYRCDKQKGNKVLQSEVQNTIQRKIQRESKTFK